ncbi:MAG: MBL fold metallo-hydrolase [Eubacteriales bacterium]
MEINAINPPHDIIMTIASSSRGNSVFARLDGTAVLIDAGVSAKRICCAVTAAGCDAASLSAIFITHEHIDHIRALPVLTKKCAANIYAPEQSAPYIVSNGAGVTPHPPVWSAEIGNIEVRSFYTPHDSDGSCGYILRSQNRTLGVCTDLGHMTDEILSMLAGCDDVILESNHDPDMLRCGGYPAQLKARIRSNYGHLSNAQCAAAAAVLASEGAHSITLAHLSEENNTPRLAYGTTMRELEARGLKTVLNVAPAGECLTIISR